MSKFTLPNKYLLKRWESELKNHDGHSKTEKIIMCDGKHFIIKYGDKKREFLAYLLGKDLVNIAEVKPILENEILEIQKLGIPLENNTNSINTYLVRLVQDYSVSELPIKKLDEAVAGELIFSTWIRRRDAHAFNRGYIQDIPVFFDSHIAISGEPGLRNIDIFFDKTQTHPGYAGVWHVEEVKTNKEVKTLLTRERQDWGGLHLVYSINNFKKAIKSFIKKIKFDRCDWKELAIQAGFEENEAGNIAQFLEESRYSLDNDSKLMLDIVLKENKAKELIEKGGE